MVCAKTVTLPNGRVLLTAGTVLKEAYIEPLLRHGVAAIYVVNALAPDVIPPEVVPEQTRQAVTQELELVMADVQKAFAYATTRGLTKLTLGIETTKLTQVVNKLVDDVLANPTVVFNLQDIRTADTYTLGHSVNVCILSTLLGVILQYSERELKDLALGTLLHDIGKVGIPPEILNKPGPLTPDEYEIMKQHTTIGWHILKDQGHLRATASVVALQHHERWAGGGYPKGLRETQIYKHARVCAVADCFDAITADRVYRKGMPSVRALELFATQMDGWFQPGLAWSFTQCVAPFPVGSLVQLNTGEQAVVIEVKRGKTYKPKVRAVLDKQGNRIPPKEYDLDAEKDIMIIRLIQEDSVYFNPALLEKDG